MTDQNKRKEILNKLQKESIGMLGTLDKDAEFIRQRVMYYGVDDKLNCYLMSMQGSKKVDQILHFQQTSFIVYGVEDPYDNSWEIEINGTAKLLDKKKSIDHALSQLKGTNPFSDVALESGISNHFDFIQITPKIVRYRIYGEALKGEPPVILNL